MSLSGRDDIVVVDTTGWRGEHQAKGAEEKYMREAPEAPVLTQERLRSLEGRDPMAAALLSVHLPYLLLRMPLILKPRQRWRRSPPPK